MLSKLLSTALLFLVLAQGALSTPQGGPQQLLCGGPYDPPCPSNQICCGSPTGNVCKLDGLACPVPT